MYSILLFIKTLMYMFICIDNLYEDIKIPEVTPWVEKIWVREQIYFSLLFLIHWLLNDMHVTYELFFL